MPHGVVRHGRKGQIRTADLSLRRRPLYPSELRPRNTYIVAFKAFTANMGGEYLAIGEPYFGATTATSRGFTVDTLVTFPFCNSRSTLPSLLSYESAVLPVPSVTSKEGRPKRRTRSS